jgi:hypothetical protein
MDNEGEKNLSHLPDMEPDSLVVQPEHFSVYVIVL